MSYDKADDRLFSMSLEELMNLEVTSAFKKPQSIKDTPAAVFVITQEDIRRSGATTIPEVLRMVPGVNVAKIDNGNWAISIRGFNGIFSDKLLVLMDGRTLYDPLFSGIFWDVQDTMLEDIERIEVVRGPGASSWGTNAVNGVINIITKDAWSTRGGLVSAGGGSLEHGVGACRYGFNVGDTGAVRFYAKAFERGAQEKKNGSDAWDDWRMIRSGFHSDWRFTSNDAATLQGDIFSGEGTSRILGFNKTFSLRKVLESDIPVSGGNILAIWTHSFERQNEVNFQFYYDHT
jgi:iron complex outermembrane receptor protein